MSFIFCSDTTGVHRLGSQGVRMKEREDLSKTECKERQRSVIKQGLEYRTLCSTKGESETGPKIVPGLQFSENKWNQSDMWGRSFHDRKSIFTKQHKSSLQPCSQCTTHENHAICWLHPLQLNLKLSHWSFLVCYHPLHPSGRKQRCGVHVNLIDSIMVHITSRLEC